LVERHPESAEKAVVILNGFDQMLEPTTVVSDGRLILLFAGTIYLDRSLFPLMEAIKKIVNDGIIERGNIPLQMSGAYED
jgi:hypothetical protein